MAHAIILGNLLKKSNAVVKDVLLAPPMV